MPTSVLASRIFRSVSLTGAVILAAGCASTATSPGVVTTAPIGYATDSSGSLARGGDGRCVRTGSWDPRNAIKECDPELVAQAAPPAPSQPEPAAQTEPSSQEPTSSALAEEPPASTEENTGAAGGAVAAAPEPTPVYVGADTFFAFDKSDLTPRGKHALDVVAERAAKLENVSIHIVGYADQIGAPDYNLALSQRRADAVRTYLIDHGVSENTLNVDARGEADPVVRCEGRQGATLIDCLQPNRRTEVEFSALAPPQ